MDVVPHSNQTENMSISTSCVCTQFAWQIKQCHKTLKEQLADFIDIEKQHLEHCFGLRTPLLGQWRSHLYLEHVKSREISAAPNKEVLNPVLDPLQD